MSVLQQLLPASRKTERRRAHSNGYLASRVTVCSPPPLFGPQLPKHLATRRNPAPPQSVQMQQMHSTSDLLRLLAAEGRPFEEVATAVAHRFGADAESKGWLARTLITLLRVGREACCSLGCVQRTGVSPWQPGSPGSAAAHRGMACAHLPRSTHADCLQDGLLFSEAEKMNAAYLLRFAAPRASGARETLLHLSLPESGEPAGVQAWAASLAGVASAPLPSQLQQYSPAPALMHQSSPQQVLGEATAPLDSQVQFCGLPLGSPPPLPWQGVHAAAAASAAAAAAAAAGWQQVAGSEGVASPWSSSQSSPPAVPPWHQTAHQLQQPCSPQQLPSPQQPLSPMQLAQQQQHQESAGLPIQQQREEEQQQQMQHLHRLLALLQQAVQAPLVPALQQELTLALHGPLAAALTAEAVNGSSSSGGGGSGGGGLQPEHVRGLTEHNSSVAAEVCLPRHRCRVCQHRLAWGSSAL